MGDPLSFYLFILGENPISFSFLMITSFWVYVG